eukprot:2118499-Amphidinium_carterae.1
MTPFYRPALLPVMPPRPDPNSGKMFFQARNHTRSSDAGIGAEANQLALCSSTCLSPQIYKIKRATRPPNLTMAIKTQQNQHGLLLFKGSSGSGVSRLLRSLGLTSTQSCLTAYKALGESRRLGGASGHLTSY